MRRTATRLAHRAALASVLGLALLTPSTVLAAGPTPSIVASEQPTASASDGNISIDPVFISPTAVPKGAVDAATGRPEHTLPPTDSLGAPPATADAQGLPLLLLAMATISLVAASLPEVRRR